MKKYFNENRYLISSSITIVIALFAQVSMSVIDNIMVGNYSIEALAAISIAINILNPITMFFLGLLSPMNPLISQSNGEKNSVKCFHLLQQGVLLSFVLSLLCIIIFWNSFFIFNWLNIEQELQELSGAYLRSLCFGIIPLFLFTLLRMFNEGMFSTKATMVIITAAIPLNIWLNWVLMYGEMGAPELGPVGAGYSTSIVWFFMFICLLINTCIKNRLKPFGYISHHISYKWQTIKNILRLGIPSSISSSVDITTLAIGGLILSTQPVHVIGAHQITLSIAWILFMIPAGVSVAVMAKIGYAFGKTSHTELHRTVKAGFVLLTIVCLTNTSIMLLLPDVLSELYTTDPDTILLAMDLLLVASITNIFNSINIFSTSVLRGLNDTKYPAVVNIFSMLLIAIAIGFILTVYFDFSGYGIWLGLAVGHFVAAILILSRLFKLLKRLDIRLSERENLAAYV